MAMSADSSIIDSHIILMECVCVLLLVGKLF